MRHGYLILFAAGCGFHSPSGSGTSPDGGGVSETRGVDGTGLGAGQLANMTVDAARSALTPSAYSYGGLVAHGIQGTKVWTHELSSWSALAGKTATGAGLWCGERLTNPTAGPVRLDYLGVVNDTTMTIWLEGEVWLDGAPGEVFHVNGDDIGFVELAPPGSSAYVRVAENAAAAVATSGAGWYPIRVGFANGDGVFDFQFRHTDPGGSEVSWTRDRLRARTSELTGVLRTVFGHQLLAGGQSLSGSQVAPPVARFEQDKLLASNPFSAAPQGADTDNNDWSARYLGQVYVTAPGAYTLRIDSHDGSRGRLGTGHAEFGWTLNDDTSGSDPPTTVQATLDAGWNDLTVDYNQFMGGRLLRVQLQGPDLTTMIEIPRESLRPVEPGDDRLAIGVNDAPATIPDDGGPNNAASSTLPVTGFTGAVGAELVNSLEISYEVNSPHWDQLTVDLEPPGSSGTHIVLRDRDGAGGNGPHFAQLTIPPTATGALAGLLNGPASGDWKLRVFDNPGGSGNTSSLIRARLTLHTRGGPDKIARSARWTSAPIDATTAAFAIDGVAWTERIPDGAGIEVRLATCQQADCSDAAWSDAVTRGMPVVIPRARYLQLRVDMTSNGSREPELRSLAIMLRRDPA